MCDLGMNFVPYLLVCPQNPCYRMTQHRIPFDTEVIQDNAFAMEDVNKGIFLGFRDFFSK